MLSWYYFDEILAVHVPHGFFSNTAGNKDQDLRQLLREDYGSVEISRFCPFLVVFCVISYHILIYFVSFLVLEKKSSFKWQDNNEKTRIMKPHVDPCGLSG